MHEVLPKIAQIPKQVGRIEILNKNDVPQKAILSKALTPNLDPRIKIASKV